MYSTSTVHTTHLCRPHFWRELWYTKGVSVKASSKTEATAYHIMAWHYINISSMCVVCMLVPI